MSKGRPDPGTMRRRRKAAGPGDALRSGTMPDWAEMVRPFKMHAVDSLEKGDMAPVVIAIRKGVIEAVACAPQVDRDLALDAACLLRRALDPDELVVGLDAHVFAARSEAEYDLAKARWPGGRMQAACDEHDACSKGELMDCLVVSRVIRGGRLMMANMGYHYHGKGGPPFRWDDKPWWTDRSEALRERVPEVLKAIMRGPGLIEAAVAAGMPIDAEVMAISQRLMRLHPEKCRRIAARAGFEELGSRGYALIVEAGFARAVREEVGHG